MDVQQHIPWRDVMASGRTVVMGILNVTPDSFSDGGRFVSPASPAGVSLAAPFERATLEAILDAAESMLAAGAHILDIGGESTRPGAAEISESVELARVLPVIIALHNLFPTVPLSIDTRKPTIAREAMEAGASIINDVSGLRYGANGDRSPMAVVAAETGADLVIMHSIGTPETMQDDPQYPEGAVNAVLSFFERQITLAERAGVHLDRLILDPGFGFGKTARDNADLLNNLSRLQAFGLPILAGLSRKGFLAALSATPGRGPLLPENRDALTAASLALAHQQGARMMRVHNVREIAPVIRLLDGLNASDT